MLGIKYMEAIELAPKFWIKTLNEFKQYFFTLCAQSILNYPA
jgi:hypothetical protein